ncbi:uncharacterized protein LOC141643483 [Silene latifolia]|uniref:uncharacterized protein LOC141643483 n=1 Tax=Silene latifolia TaxID=37657 RepID=UPI003D76E486
MLLDRRVVTRGGGGGGGGGGVVAGLRVVEVGVEIGCVAGEDGDWKTGEVGVLGGCRGVVGGVELDSDENGIAKIFNAQTRSNISEKQAINHHSYKKDQYKAWEELQNLTGIAYDPRTNKIDVQEESLERYAAFLERHHKYGKKLVKSELPNIDLLTQLFDGKSAHGVGGCFSPAMGKGSSYLTNNLEGLNIDESSGDNEDEEDNVDDQIVNLSGDESKSPPRSVARKVSQRTCLKRKSEETSHFIENKRRQASFDSVIQLLSGIGSSSTPSKAQLVSAELTRMQVAETNGDEYFVQAIRYLSDENHANNFLSLQNDNQKRIYLQGIDTFYPIA